MFDPDSNIAEQLAKAFKHHRDVEKETERAQRKVNLFKQLIEQAEKLSQNDNDEP